MLVELAVRDLGVIEDLRLGFGPGMCALTGETGAGKTMVVEALVLLLGGRPDPSRVRPGAAEAVVEGLFVTDDDEEVVLRRVVPATGRSRAYVNGALATAAELAERGAEVVEICGQHRHQGLQSARAQRDALDRHGGIDVAPLRAAAARCRQLRAQLEELGGDERARARELDLLQYQLDELDRAELTDPDEDAALDAEEDRLGDAVAHREAASVAEAALHAEGGAIDLVGGALAALDRRPPFAGALERLRSLAAELTDVATDLRAAAEGIAEDPERLDAVRRRRQLLADLRRKYGETIAEVMGHRDEVAERIAELSSRDERAGALEAELADASAVLAAEQRRVGAARRAAAPGLGAAVGERLRQLGLPHARLEVAVGPDEPGDEVELRFSANPGMEPAPLARVASGGELSRTMLALHLVLSEGAPTMVFDEVDAGVGGEAAVAVGRALAGLARRRQVIVVTHLPQVAAYADTQLRVEKSPAGLAVSTVVRLDEADRVVELSRMLSGSPDSESARRHAEELLAVAAADRGN